MGSLELLPAESAGRLKGAADGTAGIDGMRVNVCVGYGGRQELTDAIRSLLLEKAAEGHDLEPMSPAPSRSTTSPSTSTPRASPTPTSSSARPASSGSPGFLLWQSVHSEFYFCDALWPAFRRVDLLRAMRSYASRERRFGT